MKVHATASVDASAKIAGDVEIGPFAVVGAGVRIGAGCIIGPHAVLLGPMTIGQNNEVHAFAALGGSPQDLRHGGQATQLVIGDRNVFREHTTVHRGTKDSNTTIGFHNLFMVGSHVAHDVTVGSYCVVANAVQLAGHVKVRDHVAFGGLAGVAQFVTIHESAFIAAGSMVERDVPPFVIAQGDRARVRAVNVVGLKRRDVPEASIREIERVFRAVYVRRGPRAVLLQDLRTDDPWASRLLGAVRAE